jgi:hypothetical protein
LSAMSRRTEKGRESLRRNRQAFVPATGSAVPLAADDPSADDASAAERRRAASRQSRGS